MTPRLTKSQMDMIRVIDAGDGLLTTGSDRAAKSLADIGLVERDMPGRPGICIVTLTDAGRRFIAEAKAEGRW